MINKMELSNMASILRKKLGEDESSPIDVFQLVQKIENLTLIFFPMGKNISGVCYKGNKSNVIAINSGMSIGRQRFSLAHELYHLFFDKEQLSSVSYIQIGKGDEKEKKADQFAAYFVPQSSLYSLVEEIKRNNNRKVLNKEDVIRIEQYYGVSHKAMIYRLLEEGYIGYNDTKKMESGVVETAARLGYDTTLYYPTSETKNKLVLGHYIALSEYLLEKEFISQGKYEELLLAAFRDDIVYGFEGEDGVVLD